MIEHFVAQDDHVLDRFKDSQEILGEKKHHDIPFAYSWLCIIDTKRLHYLDFSLAAPPFDRWSTCLPVWKCLQWKICSKGTGMKMTTSSAITTKRCLKILEVQCQFASTTMAPWYQACILLWPDTTKSLRGQGRSKAGVVLTCLPKPKSCQTLLGTV